MKLEAHAIPASGKPGVVWGAKRKTLKSLRRQPARAFALERLQKAAYNSERFLEMGWVDDGA
jgi:hypothetical protein